MITGAIFMGILLVTALLSRRLAATMLVAPVLGLTFGGFCWALAAAVWPFLVSLEAFAGFVAMATAIAGMWALGK